MDDAYTAFAIVQATGNEGGEGVACFIAIQAMQVDFILNDPAATAQVAQHTLRQSRSQVTGFITPFQSILQGNRAMQAFVQSCPFIGQMLQGARGWGLVSQFDTPTGRQWAGITNSRMKGGKVVRVNQAGGQA